MKARDSNVIGIVGTNNTGKTVIARQLIEKFNKKRDAIKKNGKKYPVNYHKLVVFDVQNRMEDLMREGDINIRIGVDGWEKQILELRDSMIVLDDFKVLLGGDTISPELLQIFGYRMEHGLDLIFIVWSPNLFPPRIHNFIDQYYLFRTNGSDKDFVARLNGNKDKLIKCKSVLDSYFEKFTKETYGAKYPNFPFIYYDSRIDEAVKVNFK